MAHGNLWAPWAWVKEGSPDGGNYCLDDEDLASSDYDSSSRSRIDRTALTTLELYQLDQSTMENCWDRNKVAKEEVAKIEIYDGVCNDVKAFLIFANAVLNVFDKRNSYMDEAWQSGLRTSKLLHLLTDRVKEGTPARNALEEQKRVEGPAFESHLGWIRSLQSATLTAEATLAYAREWRFTSQ